ncbi:RNA polymerase sigma factor [Thalassospira lohafexi]|uniref:RNA polymerase subunit sigma-70 n=1 Tax=Thalassospira lohafexi TaxID=744227 RepID=A0A2N3L267_9PROT|nr:RNA polymerase sigma factor [Thalassospira lohafexi]PKR56901.1 hypothetical protein COO92_18110 [Thalassospira lohafexi]
MQNEKNTQQDEVNFTEAELRFARSLEDTLNQALGDGDNVTSIWSRLKPEQRVRVAEGYLSQLTPADPPQDGSAIDDARQSDPAQAFGQRDATPDFSASVAQAQTASPALNSAPNRQGPPPGYPADFNPLAGFPGLEPSRSGPSPEDIIASALPGYQGGSQISPLDALRGLLPGGFDYPAMPGTQTPRPQHSDPAPPPETVPAIDPAIDPELGPAAPNFWPLWIDQQDVLLKQCLKLMSGNMDDAQDALSEAMVKASTKFEASMDEIRNHRAWLSRIVHNACIDLHRQNRRKAEYKEETHGGADVPVSPISPPVIPSPEESFLTNEKLDQLETVLCALPEKLRKPLLMRCVQDRSYDDIAVALGLSNCAVRKRVQLARDHLKDAGIQ